MAPTANDNPEPDDDLPTAAIAQLVAYDEAKLTEAGTNGETPASAELLSELSSELACVDLLHRVWPKMRPQASVLRDHPVPEKLGDLRLVRELGRGGMGIVYEAEQVVLGRRVAVKVLPHAALMDDKSLKRFRNEVRAAAALDHPHIVAVYAAGEDSGYHYYTMQLIRGRTLADVIAELRSTKSATACQSHDSSGVSPTLPTTSVVGSYGTAEFYRTVARWGAEAAGALQHAHEVGILHRDIKPGNLMLDEAGQLYVTDFGLARVGEDAGQTVTGDIVGTLRYMAPEQALGKRVVVDQRADLYALGATLYELLSLEPVFTEADRAVLLSQIAFHDPVPLRKHDARIPIDLETIVFKTLAKEPAERYPTAASMASDLQAFAEGRSITARPPSIADRIRVWSRRHAAFVRWGLVSLVLTTVLMGIGLVRIKRAETRAEAALERSNEMLYRAQMSLAYQASTTGRPDEARRILDQYRPRPVAAGRDSRGVEWHLLDASLRLPASDVLVGHEGTVNELAVFPDRKRLASVGEDGALRIWSVAEHTHLRTIPLSKEGLKSVAITPDGQFVAAGNEAIYLCDLESSGPAAKIFRAEQNVESLAFHPNGQELVAGVRYHDVFRLTRDGKVINRIPCESRVESLEYLADGGALLIPNQSKHGDSKIGFTALWKADLSAMTTTLNRGNRRGLCQITVARPSPTGRFVVAGEYYQSRVSIFDLTNGEVSIEIPRTSDLVTDVAYAADGMSIAVACRNGQIACYDFELNARGSLVTTRSPLHFAAHHGAVTSVRFVGEHTLATSGTDGIIRIWKLPHWAEAGYDLVGMKTTGTAVSPDGRRLLCTCPHGYVIAEAMTGKVLVEHHDIRRSYQLPIWSPRGDRAAVLCAKSGFVFMVKLDGSLGARMNVGSAAAAIEFSPDGSLMVVIGGQRIQIFNADTGQRVFAMTLHEEGRCAAFSRDGALLACGEKSGQITVLDAETRHVLNTISCGSDTRCIAFGPDGQLLATGHTDTTIRLWNAKSGRLEGELKGHDLAVRDLAFSPDGLTLLSGSDDGTIRVWSVPGRTAFGIFYRRIDDPTTENRHRFDLSLNGETLAMVNETETDGVPDVYVWRLTQDGPVVMTGK
jgi:serine/threonine protein kinase/WD40 repeat protein